MEYYANLRDNRVLPRLKKRGVLMYLVKYLSESFNDTTGDVTTGTSTSYPVYGVLTGSRKRRWNPPDDARDTLVEETMVDLLYLEATGVPANFDMTYRLQRGTKVSDIVRIEPLEPGGIPVLYQIEVKR